MRSALILLSCATVLACVPPAEEVRLVDIESACAELPPGASLIAWDTTDPVRHRLSGELVCPRGFGPYNILVDYGPDQPKEPPPPFRCGRNRRNVNCDELISSQERRITMRRTSTGRLASCERGYRRPDSSLTARKVG